MIAFWPLALVRKRMLSILDAESSKDELTISEHDQFGKEYEELSAHMLTFFPMTDPHLYVHGPRSSAHRPPAMLSSRQICFNAVS